MADARTLPHNAEAEASVLGGVLLRGRDALTQVSDVVRPEEFYVPGHQAVFRAMLALDERGEPIDVVTLEAYLRGRDELRLIGGMEGISALSDRYATAHNIVTHANLIAEAALLRSLVITTREVAQDGMGEVEDVRRFVDEASQKVVEVADRGQRANYVPARKLIHQVFSELTTRRQSESSVTGVATHYAMLDEMTAGLQPGDLIILAARPSMGKTAFALNMAQNACVPGKHWAELPEDKRPLLQPVLFFSLEMGAGQLIERVLASEARVDYGDLRRGRLNSQWDTKNLIAAADRIQKSPMFIDDRASPTILEIRNAARRWKSDRSVFPEGSRATHGPKAPIGMIMVDYLQLCRGGKGRYDSREQEISEISRGLKALAKELAVPVIALSQLNRSLEGRSDKRPQLSDLRESGAIEQDADVIMFIHRQERYHNAETPEAERKKWENKAEVIIGKQRNGPVGTVELHFLKRFTRFENPADDPSVAGQ